MNKILSALAWIVSILFHPIGMAAMGSFLFAICCIAPFIKEPFQPEILTLAFKTSIPIFILYYVMPLFLCSIYGLFFMHKKDVNGINEKQHRIILLILILFIYVVNLFNPSIAELFFPYTIACCIVILIAGIITLFWQISLHTIGMGGLLGLLSYTHFLGFPYDTIALQILPYTIIVAGLVGTARLYLNAHTPTQIYTGYLLGFIGVLICMILLT